MLVNIVERSVLLDQRLREGQASHVSQAGLRKVAPVMVEPAIVEPVKVEVTGVEPARVEPARVEPARVEPARLERARIEPATIELVRAERAKGEPALHILWLFDISAPFDSCVVLNISIFCVCQYC